MILLGFATSVIVWFFIFENHNSKSKFDYRRNKSEVSLNKEKVSIENVRINKNNKFAWTVIGEIKNETSSKIKGYVKIKFLNSSGNIIYSAMTNVNDGDYFKAGQSASFDYYTETENFLGVTKFEVYFVEK